MSWESVRASVAGDVAMHRQLVMRQVHGYTESCNGDEAVLAIPFRYQDFSLLYIQI